MSNIRELIDRVEAAGGVAHPDDVMAVVAQLRRFETLLQTAQQEQGPFVAYFVDVPRLVNDIAEKGESRALVVTAPGMDMDDVKALASLAGSAIMSALYGSRVEE